MYHTRKNPLRKVTTDSEAVETVRTGRNRKLHKALLRYHDPENWEIIREGLQRMGRSDLIGSGENHLVPRHSPKHGLVAMERNRETPGPDKLAKKFGHKTLRPGAAIVRKPATKSVPAKGKGNLLKTGRK
jgi:hypothetical protein